MLCLDAQSGATLWSTAPLRSADSDDYFWGGAIIAGGLVLAGSGSGGETPTARGRLTAYELRTGALRWSVPMVDRGETGGGILAPASVDFLRGSAYVCTGSPTRRMDAPWPAPRRSWSSHSTTAASAFATSCPAAISSAST